MTEYGLDYHLQIILEIIMFLILAVIAIGIILRITRDYLGKTVTVEAKDIDKYATRHQQASNVEPAHTVTDYVVVFDVGGKTKRFLTSVWVYDSVEKNEKGTLEYKGNRFISFK